MELVVTKRLESFLLTKINEPCVLVVDHCCLSSLENGIWFKLIKSSKWIRNIVDVESSNWFLNNQNDKGMICPDLGEVRLAICIITSLRGEEQMTRFKTVAPQQLRTIIIASTSEAKNRMHNPPLKICEFVPFCLSWTPRLGLSTFVSNCEPCPAPSLATLGISKSSIFEIDLENDVDQSYKSKLKQIALSLGTAITQQMQLDISEGVYSMGFGSSLLANTICANFTQSNLDVTNNLKQKASLMIVDRTLDWWSLLDDPALQHFQRLHDQLINARQSDEVIPLLNLSLEKGNLTSHQAFALAVRACSLAGNSFDFSSSSLENFAYHLQLPLDRLKAFLLDITKARDYCLQNASDAGKYTDNSATAGPLEPDESLVSTVIRKILYENSKDFRILVRANKFDVTKVALNIFGTVFGGESSRNNDDRALKEREHLIIFYLGGFSSRDVRTVESVIRSKQVYVGGTEAITNTTIVQEELFSSIGASSIQQKIDVATNRKNISSLSIFS
jgi:hypothetical protein